MGKKGGSGHLKRKPAPRFWPIHRKEYVWTVKPKPGPHSLANSLPLAIVMRDILGYAKTRKEAKNIIFSGKLTVDGKIRKDDAFPVGLMDVITIPEAKAIYRVLPHKSGLTLHPIGKEEAMFKLCRIENKTVVKGGRLQLNLHDGQNKLVQVPDPKSTKSDSYKTLDVVKIAIPSGEIVQKVELKKGAAALIIGGKNRGTRGKIVEIEEAAAKKRRSLLATIQDSAGKRLQTILDFIFVVEDREKPASTSKV